MIPAPIPPRPVPRPDRVSLWRHLRLSWRNILSAQPARLYRAWMAGFRTLFIRSVLVHDPALLRRGRQAAEDFPKSGRVGAGLRPLLGESVFLTNGATWARQRRVIDPAFGAGRLWQALPAMWAAGEAACARLPLGGVEVGAAASRTAADVILRTLSSRPIEERAAAEVVRAFRAHQRTQPTLNLAAFVPGPAWMARLFWRRTRTTARAVRALIAELTRARAREIAAGAAPDDLVTKIMTTAGPLTGERLGWWEMVDQVAIFFLAGHEFFLAGRETSASALAWTLWLLAASPDWQERAVEEARGLVPDMGAVARLRVCRDSFREALRLYPPVPMIVREAARAEAFRGREVARGAQAVVSPWHLHRRERIWPNPDGFGPGRWATEDGRACGRDAFIPFSRGARACPDAGFPKLEGPLLLAMLLRRFRFEGVEGRVPMPVAHLTARGQDGTWLRVTARGPAA